MLPREIAMASSRWRMRERAMKMNNTLFSNGRGIGGDVGRKPGLGADFSIYVE